jgi:hypothetical protein
MGQKIGVVAEEKVGFPNYSNVVYRAFVERDIPDDADPVEEMRKAGAEVEVYMAEERQKVNDLLVAANG